MIGIPLGGLPVVRPGPCNRLWRDGRTFRSGRGTAASPCMYMLRAYQSPSSMADCGPQCDQMPNFASRNQLGTWYACSDSRVGANGADCGVDCAALNPRRARAEYAAPMAFSNFRRSIFITKSSCRIRLAERRRALAGLELWLLPCARSQSSPYACALPHRRASTRSQARRRRWCKESSVPS